MGYQLGWFREENRKAQSYLQGQLDLVQVDRAVVMIALLEFDRQGSGGCDGQYGGCRRGSRPSVVFPAPLS